MQEEKNIMDTTGLEEGAQPKAKSQNHRRVLAVVLGVVLVLSLVANVVLLVGFLRVKASYDDLDKTYSPTLLYYNSITVERFKEMVESGEDFIVNIGRANCLSCRMIEDDFIALTNRLGVTEDVYYLNVVILRRDQEAWDAFKQSYGLDGTPTFARYAQGAQLSRCGWAPEDNITIEEVEAWLRQQDSLEIAG